MLLSYFVGLYKAFKAMLLDIQQVIRPINSKVTLIVPMVFKVPSGLLRNSLVALVLLVALVALVALIA